MLYVLVFNYIRFWYTKGFLRLLTYLKAYIVILADVFSVKTSILTLFSPWKRDVTSLKGLPLDEKFRVIIFNVVARIFGAVVKTITLAAFLVCLAILLAFCALAILVWLLLPTILVEGIVIGVLFILS